MSRKTRLAAAVMVATTAAVMLTSATTTTAVAGQPAFAPVPGQYYQMQVVNGGLRLEVAFAATGLAPIIQGPGSTSYRPSHWRFDRIAGDFYQIVNRNSGDCISGGVRAVRLVIKQNGCLTLASYQWAVSENPTTGHVTINNRGTTQSLCIIGDLIFPAVPLVSDAAVSACDKRFRLIPVS